MAGELVPLVDKRFRTFSAPDQRIILGSSLAAYGARLYDALAAGIRSGLPVIAVCAAAGVITSIIAKTGLGQILSDLLVSAAAALSPNDATLLILSALALAIRLWKRCLQPKLHPLVAGDLDRIHRRGVEHLDQLLDVP